MKERIKQFMDYKTLSAAELADQIGVQRSNVSHVLSGRNNPSSSFLEKLLLTFPELDARWLIVGEGQMLKESTPGFSEKNVAAINRAEEKKTEESLIRGGSVDNKKEIERIVILYKDRTFKDYFPEN